MICRWIDRSIAYDGSQLSAHWILSETGIVGDSLVAFRGPCKVRRDEIADLADIDGPGIAADDMVHFVWESFSDTGLMVGVHRQRLLSATALEVLRAMRPDLSARRDGDDLFIGDGKLSISIATVTPVSCLIHFAVNASHGGAPVRIAALSDLRVDARAFAESLLAQVASEQVSIADARCKVRAKGEWAR